MLTLETEVHNRLSGYRYGTKASRKHGVEESRPSVETYIRGRDNVSVDPSRRKDRSLRLVKSHGLFRARKFHLSRDLCGPPEPRQSTRTLFHREADWDVHEQNNQMFTVDVDCRHRDQSGPDYWPGFRS